MSLEAPLKICPYQVASRKEYLWARAKEAGKKTLGAAWLAEHFGRVGKLKQFDPEYLVGMSGGDMEFVCDILSTFLETAINLVNGLVAAGNESNPEKAIYASHTLKGSSRSIGAAPLGDLCEDLEKLARSGDMQGFQGLVKQVLVSFDELSQELTAFIQPLAA